MIFNSNPNFLEVSLIYREVVHIVGEVKVSEFGEEVYCFRIYSKNISKVEANK